MPEFLYSDHLLRALDGLDPPEVHPRFTEMNEYLRRIAPEGGLPGRQHLDPLKFHHVLALVNLVNVEREGGQLRFRFRLVGEEQNRAAGRKITGLTVEEAVIAELAPRIIDNMTKVLQQRLPVYDMFVMPHPNREFIDSQRMYYPLASDGHKIDVLLILNGYDRMPLEASA